MRGSPELLTSSCQLKLLESASPIAFADLGRLLQVHAEFQAKERRPTALPTDSNPIISGHLSRNPLKFETGSWERRYPWTLSEWIASLAVRISEQC